MNGYEMAAAAAAIALLVPCTVSDIKRQRISVPLMIAALAGSILFAAWGAAQGERTVSALFLSLMPGIFLLFVAGIAPGRIGAGDGAVFVVIGLLIGCWNAFAVMFLALVMSAIYGGSLILRRKGTRSSTMAWMPFVLSGMLIWWAWSIWTGGVAI